MKSNDKTFLKKVRTSVSHVLLGFMLLLMTLACNSGGGGEIIEEVAGGGLSGTGDDPTPIEVSFEIEDLSPGLSKSRGPYILSKPQDIDKVLVFNVNDELIGEANYSDERIYTIHLATKQHLKIHVHIRLNNESVIILEKVIPSAGEGIYHVGENSTATVAMLLDEVVRSEKSLPELLDEQPELVNQLKEVIEDIKATRFINRVLDQEKRRGGGVGEQIQRIQRAVHRLRLTLKVIKNLGMKAERFALTDFQGEGDFSEGSGIEIDFEDIFDQLPRPGNEEVGEIELDVGVDDSILIHDTVNIVPVDIRVNGRGARHITGRVLTSTANRLLLKVVTRDGLNEFEFFPNPKKAWHEKLLENLIVEDKIGLVYKVEDDQTRRIVSFRGKGVTTGKVIEKGVGFIVVENDAGSMIRFYFSESEENSETNVGISSIIRGLEVLSRVQIKWSIDEKKWIDEIERVNEPITVEGAIE